MAGGTKSVRTAVKKVELAEGFERLAAEMADVSLVRSLRREGDHEPRHVSDEDGDTGPTPPSNTPRSGAVCCHELPEGQTGIPRHVSILPAQWPGAGGFLGGAYDAFQVGDPAGPLPDVSAFVSKDRDRTRVGDLDVVETAFASGPLPARPGDDAPRRPSRGPAR
ncbi:MAG: DUF1501 domain-containing protein [Isosphaeraceae bacterium]